MYIKVYRVAGNVLSNRSCFACRVECVRSKPVRCVGARRTMTAAFIKEPRGGGYVVL